MESLNPQFVVEVKKRKLSSELLCFLCKTKSSETLILNPTDSSYDKLVQWVINRSVWGEEKCSSIKRSFGDEFSINSLKSKNVRWYRSCYQLITHKQVCDRLQKQYTECLQRKEHEKEKNEESGPSQQQRLVVTRAKVPVYEKSKCFFCDKGETYKEKLSKVATDNAGINLRKAVQLSQNDIFHVRLNAAVNPTDAHAIDVLYHRKCWATHVTNVLRRYTETEDGGKIESSIALTASKVDFIGSLSEALAEGKIFDMGTLEETFRSVCSVNGVSEDKILNRKELKKLIEIELSEEGIEFSRPKRVNEPHRVSMKCTRDAILESVESETDKMNRELGILYQASLVRRKKIMKCKRWFFEGSLPLDMKEVIPEEVQTFFNWCIKGKCDIISSTIERKDKDMEKTSEVLSQMLMSSILTERQLKNISSTQFHNVRETPLQVAVGLTLHGSTRNKRIIEMFHGLGYSIDYPRVLRLETQIASSVLEKIRENNGIYLPPDIVRGRFIHCAADNLDFCEDTVDGKRTLHGTVMAIYQVNETSDKTVPLSLKSSNERSLSNANDALPVIVPFHKPSNWTTCCPEPKLYKERPLAMTVIQDAKLNDLAWLLLRKKFISEEDHASEINAQGGMDADDVECATNATSSPTWSGYMSLLGETKPVSKVSVLPLIAASPTDHSVQLTFMKQLGGINSFVLGPDSKVVVTVDMALYKPLKQLEMANKDCQGKWVLKPGELHIIIAQLRTIGDFIHGSGIPELWIESNLYGTATTRQIIEGKYVRRALEAHITTLSALTILLLEEFSQENSSVFEPIVPHVSNVENSLNKEEINIKRTHLRLHSALKNQDILEKLIQFCNKRGQTEPIFKFIHTYMDMVETMLLFVKAVRSSDWLLSLAALKCFLNIFLPWIDRIMHE